VVHSTILIGKTFNSKRETFQSLRCNFIRQPSILIAVEYGTLPSAICEISFEQSTTRGFRHYSRPTWRFPVERPLPFAVRYTETYSRLDRHAEYGEPKAGNASCPADLPRKARNALHRGLKSVALSSASKCGDSSGNDKDSRELGNGYAAPRPAPIGD
jgi:hypothetical protein